MDKLSSSPDLQDPLPESKWFYRRVLMFGFATFMVVFWSGVTLVIARLAYHNRISSDTAIKALSGMSVTLAWIVGLLMVLYLIAPSGEQIAKMTASVASLKHGGFGQTYGGNTEGSGAESDPHPDKGDERLS